MNTTSNTIAGAAIISPLWLHAVSDVAAIALPILGCTWLLIQIGYFIWRNR